MPLKGTLFPVATRRTSMRRHILSSRRGGPAVVECNSSALRAMLPSALSVSSLFGDPVHRMRSVFSGSAKVLQSSERSLLLEVGPSSQLRSHLMVDPKRDRAKEAVLCATLGSSLLCQDLYLLFSFLAPPSYSLAKPLHFRADACTVEWFVSLSGHPQAMQ